MARTYDITTNVVGNGSVNYTRSEFDPNQVEFNIFPDVNYHFVKYVFVGLNTSEYQLTDADDNLITTQDNDTLGVTVGISTETTNTPFTIVLQRDITVTAYFEQNPFCHITAIANIENASIYISRNDDYSGYSSTLKAREFPGYEFIQWGDGITANPRTVTVTSDITYYAIYRRVEASFQTSGTYRCYIKDQMNLTAAPKVFLRVDAFDIRRDLLTTSNSTIKCFEKVEDVEDGDILVLYTPEGKTLYQGVVKSVEDYTITCSQMASFYKGNWVYNTYSETSLEKELAHLLGQYAQGKIYHATWRDLQVAQRLGGITVDYVNSTNAHLPKDLDEEGNEQYTVIDMEDFIYSCYANYGIVFDFQINFSGANYVTIKVPTFEKIKIGDNIYAIKNMAPIQTVEETNKLIIYDKNKEYVTTYIARTNNTIIEEPDNRNNRFKITDTAIVFANDLPVDNSDGNLTSAQVTEETAAIIADLVAANLPNTMYNHKLTFDLILRNFVYDINEFNLGGPLDVWHGSDYYDTVLTGYEIRKNSGQNITEANFICGLVRVALTKKLKLGKV